MTEALWTARAVAQSSVLILLDLSPAFDSLHPAICFLRYWHLEQLAELDVIGKTENSFDVSWHGQTSLCHPLAQNKGYKKPGCHVWWPAILLWPQGICLTVTQLCTIQHMRNQASVKHRLSRMWSKRVHVTQQLIDLHWLPMLAMTKINSPMPSDVWFCSHQLQISHTGLCSSSATTFLQGTASDITTPAHKAFTVETVLFCVSQNETSYQMLSEPGWPLLSSRTSWKPISIWSTSYPNTLYHHIIRSNQHLLCTFGARLLLYLVLSNWFHTYFVVSYCTEALKL